ncbi:antibiotic biosynthesis monooxygenase [Streptomyces sp. NPDC058872]|uniref:antibiotic biosynthesis monooxygenase n=1 Tax=Streptomyces sp. NPDC058872 TaxID=3346661 RepID=UPI0036A8509E
MNAVARPDARPDLYRPTLGAVLASTWSVGTAARQQAAIEAIRTAWERRDWPDPRLLSYSVYVGTDEDTLLHYSQWTDQEAYDAFVRVHRDDRNAEIDAAVPGIERVALHRYAPPHRSAVLSGDGAAAVPGAVAVVEVDFEGPDADRQDAWVEAAVAALAGEDGTRSVPGGIGAHFHRSVDDTRVLGFTEWEGVPAHVAWEAVHAPLHEAWQRLFRRPGLVGSRVHRYVPALSLDAGA